LRVPAEFSRVMRFGFVGAVATAVHAVTYLALVAFLAVMPSLANVVAYVAAVVVSMVGHISVTFRLDFSARRATKVAFASLLSFGLNASFVCLVTRLQYPPELAVIFFVTVTPAVTYAALRTLLATD
jgi:putative flippase GtrA